MTEIAFSAILNFVSFIGVFYFSWNAFFKRHLFFRGMWGLGYSVLFSFIPSMSNLFIGAHMYHPEAIDGEISELDVYILYSVLNFVFSLIYIVFLLSKKRGMTRQYELTAQSFKYLKNIFGIIFLFAVFLYIKSTGFQAPTPVQLIQLILHSGRMAHFNNASYNSLFMNISFYLMSSIAVFTYLDIRLKKRNMFFSVIVYSFLILITILSGARQFIMLAISAAFLAYYISPRFSKSKLIIISSLCATLLISWQMIRAAIFLGTFDKFSFESLMITILSGDLSYFYYSSLESIRQYLSKDILFFANIYRNLFFIFLPNEWTFGMKQQDLSYLFSFAYESSNAIRSGNYPPGLIGMFILNFGVLGVILLGVPLIVFIRFVEDLKIDGITYLALGSSFIFLTLQLFRGTLLGIYQMIALLLMVSFIDKMLKLLKR